MGYQVEFVDARPKPKPRKYVIVQHEGYFEVQDGEGGPIGGVLGRGFLSLEQAEQAISEKEYYAEIQARKQGVSVSLDPGDALKAETPATPSAPWAQKVDNIVDIEATMERTRRLEAEVARLRRLAPDENVPVSRDVDRAAKEAVEALHDEPSGTVPPEGRTVTILGVKVPIRDVAPGDRGSF